MICLCDGCDNFEPYQIDRNGECAGGCKHPSSTSKTKCRYSCIFFSPIDYETRFRRCISYLHDIKHIELATKSSKPFVETSVYLIHRIQFDLERYLFHRDELFKQIPHSCNHYRKHSRHEYDYCDLCGKIIEEPKSEVPRMIMQSVKRNEVKYEICEKCNREMYISYEYDEKLYCEECIYRMIEKEKSV